MMPYHQIHLEVFNGNIEAVTKILSTNPEIINTLDSNKQTPIFLACHSGKVAIVKFLIAQGADLAIADCHDITPLHRIMDMIILHKAQDIECYYEIIDLILQKDVSLMTIRGQFLEYPLYKLYDYKPAMDRILLMIKKHGTIHKILPAFLEDLNHRSFTMRLTAAITLSHIYQIIPETQQKILQTLLQFLRTESNPYQWSHVTRALAIIMQTQIAISPTVLQPIIRQFLAYLDNILIPAIVVMDSLDILGGICKRNPEIIIPQILPILVAKLSTDNVDIKNKIVATISNISKAIPQERLEDIVRYFIQVLNNKSESEYIKKYIVDILATISIAVPQLITQITSVFINTLEVKTVSEDLKIYVLIALQKLCEEILKINMQQALELALQMEPILEQLLSNQDTSIALQQQAGKILANIYIAIPEFTTETPPAISQPSSSLQAAAPETQGLLTHRRIGHTS